MRKAIKRNVWFYVKDSWWKAMKAGNLEVTYFSIVKFGAFHLIPFSILHCEAKDFHREGLKYSLFTFKYTELQF